MYQQFEYPYSLKISLLKSFFIFYKYNLPEIGMVDYLEFERKCIKKLLLKF
jgi:hypothetical protein